MEKIWIWWVAVALIMSGVISLFASPEPDGLERVAINIFGGEEQMEEHTKETYNAPMPDYVIPGIENEALAASLAGIIGVSIMIVLATIIGKVLKA